MVAGAGGGSAGTVLTDDVDNRLEGVMEVAVTVGVAGTTGANSASQQSRANRPKQMLQYDKIQTARCPAGVRVIAGVWIA